MTGTDDDDGRDWATRIMAAAPETARQIAHQAELALDTKTQRGSRTRAEIASDYPRQLPARPRHLCDGAARRLDARAYRRGQGGPPHVKPLGAHAGALQRDHALGESRCLAVAGYWVGAAARWRGLHELAVTARLIAESGSKIAQRYLDHGFVVQTSA
jgi:hypothetical protein